MLALTKEGDEKASSLYSGAKSGSKELALTKKNGSQSGPGSRDLASSLAIVSKKDLEAIPANLVREE